MFDTRALGRRSAARTLPALVLALCGCSCLLGCGPRIRVEAATPLRATARWVLGPIDNLSETAQAGDRARVLLRTLLHQRGIATIDGETRGPDTGELELLGEPRYRRAFALAAAGGHGYFVAGAVTEWRSRAGADGEPVVGLELRIVELPSGRVLFSGVASETGWPRAALTETALSCMSALLSRLVLSP